MSVRVDVQVSMQVSVRVRNCMCITGLLVLGIDCAPLSSYLAVTPTPTCTHGPIHAHPSTPTRTYTHPHTPTHPHTHAHAHTRTPTHPHTPTCTHTQAHTRTLTHSLTHSHTNLLSKRNARLTERQRQLATLSHGTLKLLLKLRFCQSSSYCI